MVASATGAPRTRDPGGYRKAAPWLAALMLLAIPAFWPTYLYVDRHERDWHVHFHGLSLFAWAALLIVQPWLIARGQWNVHRALGKTSYALAPMVVVSTLLLGNYRLKAQVTPELLYFLYVQAQLLVVFVVAYAQAIRHRHESALHARYMVCTALAMLDPIVARLLFNHLAMPYPFTQAVTWLVVDAIVAYLWWRDAKAGSGIRVFPGMLALLVVLQVPTFFLYKTEAWLAFARAYAALPLP